MPHLGIANLSRSKWGIDVNVNRDGKIFRVPAVSDNVVRCIVGESDMEYLLSSTADESHCFKLSESELEELYRCSNQ